MNNQIENKPKTWVLRTWSADGKYCHVNQCESERYLNMVIADMLKSGARFEIEGLRR